MLFRSLILRDSGQWFGQQVPATARTLDEARSQISAELRPSFEAHLQRITQWADLPTGLDALQLYRKDVAEGLDYVYTVPPRLDDVIFHDAASVRAQITRYLSDAALRQEIARAQREYVETYFTYEAGMQRVLRRIRALISDENASTKNLSKTTGVEASCA